MKDKGIWTLVVLYVISFAVWLLLLRPWEGDMPTDERILIWAFIPLLAWMCGDAVFLWGYLIAGWSYWLWCKVRRKPLPEARGGLWDD